MMTYVNKPDAPYTEGLIIFLLMMVCQFGRTYCFYGMSYVISTFSSQYLTFHCELTMQV